MQRIGTQRPQGILYCSRGLPKDLECMGRTLIAWGMFLSGAVISECPKNSLKCLNGVPESMKCLRVDPAVPCSFLGDSRRSLSALSTSFSDLGRPSIQPILTKMLAPIGICNNFACAPVSSSNCKQAPVRCLCKAEHPKQRGLNDSIRKE